MATKSLKIPFDSNHNPITPTIVLANRDGNKLGVISKAYSFHVMDAMAEIPTLSFKVTKRDNDEILPIWDEITSLKLIWCVEWDYWFEIRVELEDTNETIKSVDCTALAQAELSQTNLYDVEINTETDISREAYDIPTTVYNDKRPDASLLIRMLDKNPNYSVKHVDDTLKNIQRTFEFNGTSLKDCFNEVEQEIGALFVYGNNSVDDEKYGKVPERTISLYDMESNCAECGFRGEFEDKCPKCGKTNITEGYGEDTTIFISKDNLTDDVTFSTDVDSIKNCFRLVGGDELMTATIRNCNANGSGYVWFIPEMMKHDMPKELVDKLEEYDKEYIKYQNEYELNIPAELIQKYNDLIEQYQDYNEDLKPLPEKLVGYTSLSHAFYDIIDFSLYLEHSLMPIPKMEETNATTEAAKLTSGNLSPCAVTKMQNISQSTAELSVLSMAKVIVRPTYKLDIHTSNYTESSHQWVGTFTVTNYSDEEDTANSNSVTVEINEDYKRFIQQKLEKALTDADRTEEYGIVALFKKKNGEFEAELKKYGLVPLQTFYTCCQVCIDVLTEYGAGNSDVWEKSGLDYDLYKEFYSDYMSKLSAIEKEIKTRESETDVIQQLRDALTEERQKIQAALDLETFLGKDLWKIFCSYRREDQYENSNYISDGLSNSDLFRRADEFIESAQRDLFKSATMQHHISATLKNLLVIKEFEKLLDYFEVGNWMRIECDGVVYKLRMIRYEIDFDDLEYINIEFSDVVNTIDGRSDIWSILSRADSVASSYDSYRKRSEKGEDASNQMNNWFEYGLDTTLTRIVKNADNQDILWDEHGLLFREKDDVTGEFRPEQMKIINKTIAITSDAWKTLKTAIGNFYYVNPKTKTLENGYGINGEVVIGKLILGEGLGIYNDSGSLTFDQDGFKIFNDKNTFTVNPNSNELLKLSNSMEDIFWVDVTGMVHIKGDGAGLDITSNSSITGLQTSFQVNEKGIQAEVKRATEAEGALSSRITVNENGIKTEVERAKGAEGGIGDRITKERSEIDQKADSIELKVTKETERATGQEQNLQSQITITSESIKSEVSRATKKEEELNGQIETTSEELYSEIEQTATDITAKVSEERTRATGIETSLQSQIKVNSTSITTEVSRATAEEGKIYSQIKETADSITLSVTNETNRAKKAEGDETTRAQKAEGDEASRAKKAEEGLQSQIELLPGKMKLSVTGSLGSNASITLTVGDKTTSTANMDLTGVRQKFASDTSAIEIKAGAITFDAKMLIVKGDNFSLDANGNVKVSGAITATSGKIGDCSIVDGKLKVPVADITDLKVTNAQITGQLSANQLSIDKLSAISADLGTITAGTIKSSTYSYSSGNYSTSGMEINLAGAGYIRAKNFAIDGSGNAYLKGGIEATSGTIGGWTIKSNIIYNNIEFTDKKDSNSSGIGNYGTDWAFWAGNGRFTVKNNGQIHAENADIKGKIHATELSVTDQVTFLGGHYISSEEQAQAMYFSAQDPKDDDYKLFFGTVQANSNTRAWTLCPSRNAALYLGQNNHQWSTIFSNSGNIQTSDRNKKNSITTLLSSKYESLFSKLKPVSYKFNTGDRIHTGFISQDIEEAMEETGLTAMDWGGFCKDQNMDPDSKDEYNYSLRYDEVVPLNTHMIQKTMARVDDNATTIQRTLERVDDNAETIRKLTARISELEQEVTNLKSAQAN